MSEPTRLTWRPTELPPVTGLGLAFWRKMIRQRKIKFSKVEGAVLIHDADLRRFLEGKKEGDESECQAAKQ